MINKAIDERSINMPPTREGLKKLFIELNLDISPVKVLDCLISVRGKRMEQSNPDDFNMDKLLTWVMKNIRTFYHLDYSTVDPEWLEDFEHNQELARKSIPAPAWKPHPQAYIRRGTGNGGTHINHILRKKNLRKNFHPIVETDKSAF